MIVHRKGTLGYMRLQAAKAARTVLSDYIAGEEVGASPEAQDRRLNYVSGVAGMLERDHLAMPVAIDRDRFGPVPKRRLVLG